MYVDYTTIQFFNEPLNFHTVIHISMKFTVINNIYRNCEDLLTEGLTVKGLIINYMEELPIEGFTAEGIFIEELLIEGLTDKGLHV